MAAVKRRTPGASAHGLNAMRHGGHTGEPAERLSEIPRSEDPARESGIVSSKSGRIA